MDLKMYSLLISVPGQMTKEFALSESDLGALRRQLPKLQLWQRLSEGTTDIELSQDGAKELLEAMKHHLQTAEWDRDPYCGSGIGSSSIMWWHRLFRDHLIPWLES